MSFVTSTVQVLYIVVRSINIVGGIVVLVSQLLVARVPAVQGQGQGQGQDQDQDITQDQCQNITLNQAQMQVQVLVLVVP